MIHGALNGNENLESTESETIRTSEKGARNDTDRRSPLTLSKIGNHHSTPSLSPRHYRSEPTATVGLAIHPRNPVPQYFPPKVDELGRFRRDASGRVTVTCDNIVT